MSTVVLPLRADADLYSMRCELSGVEYGFTFAWNPRDEAWYFDIADAVDAPIRCGLKVVIGVPLLRQCVDERAPPGDLIAIDTTGADEEPGHRELGPEGSRVVIAYADGDA